MTHALTSAVVIAGVVLVVFGAAFVYALFYGNGK